MTVSSDNWATLLQASLEHWANGRAAQGGKGLQQVLSQLQGPAMAVWRAFVYNQLALLSNQLGHWQYAREQWELAQDNWRASGMRPGCAELEPTLDWYVQLLNTYGFRAPAQQVRQLHASGLPPLLDPWNLPATAGDALPASPAAPAESLAAEEYAPLGGARVEWRPSQEIAFDSWDQAVARALQLASEGKLPASLKCLDKARDMAVVLRQRDGGHVLSLVYNAEALVCFVAGDYGSATQARQEAARLWAELKNATGPYKGDVHDRFAEALREGGQARAAELVERRHGQRQCPLIDPWVDLETGIAKGEWQQSTFQLAKDWKPKLETALQHLSRGNGPEATKELGLMQQRMSPQELRGPAGALLLQVQSLVAYASGDYDNAQELFTRARTLWDELPKSKRREGPYLDQTRSLLTMYHLESIADVLGDSLCDPFLYYKPEHQMQRVEPPAAEDGDSRGSWEEQLREAWTLARKGRWEHAQRRAHHAERVARLIDNEDLRVCYSLNSQALFAQAAGNYADSETIFEETERAWKRGARSAGARTAWNEFCLLLRESDWPELATRLESMWEKPVAKSAFEPVLLPLDALSATQMAVISLPTEPQADSNVLRLPGASESAGVKPAAAGKSGGAGKLIGLFLLLGLLLAGAWVLTHRPLGGSPAATASP